MDDIGWWVDGADDEAVSAKLSQAAATSIDWEMSNGVAFVHGRTEAAIFRRKKTPSTARVKVGSDTVPFNKEPTRWLGVWLDSQLTLKDHHAIRLKEGKTAMAMLCRLAGQMGLSPAKLQGGHNGMHSVSRHVRIGAVVEGRPHPGHHRPGKRASATSQPEGASDDRLLSDNQPWLSVNGVRIQCGDAAAAERAVRATVSQPTTGGPGTGDSGHTGGHRAEGCQRLGIYRQDAEHIAARGTGSPRCGAAAGGRGGSQSRGGERSTGAHHVHGRVTARRWGYLIRGDMEERPVLGGIKIHRRYNQKRTKCTPSR